MDSVHETGPRVHELFQGLFLNKNNCKIYLLRHKSDLGFKINLFKSWKMYFYTLTLNISLELNLGPVTLYFSPKLYF